MIGVVARGAADSSIIDVLDLPRAVLSTVKGGFVVDESEIGANIRRLRGERGLSLTRLADICGMTKGYLSKVENSPKAPPVATLVNIAKALNVSMSMLFGETDDPAVCTVVRRSERAPMAMNGTPFGYSYETLVDRFPGRHMDAYVLTIPADTKRTPDFHHPGEELLVVQKGALRFYHGDHEFVMNEGDSVYFDSGIAHRSLPIGEEDAECLIVVFTS